MRSKLDALVTKQSLAFVHAYDEILENTLEDPEARLAAKSEIRNVCAHVSKELAEEINQVCKFLDIKKRAFLEAAFIDAVERAHQIMEQEGVHRILDEHGNAVRKEA